MLDLWARDNSLEVMELDGEVVLPSLPEVLFEEVVGSNSHVFGTA